MVLEEARMRLVDRSLEARVQHVGFDYKFISIYTLQMFKIVFKLIKNLKLKFLQNHPKTLQ